MKTYNKANMEIYEMYLASNKARNYESLNTTYRVYRSNMLQYMQYLQKWEGNRLLLSDSTIKNCVSILERYINFCREAGNNNQTINNKLTAISSFYIWCVKRDLITHHPFMHKLDRLRKGAFDKRRESYFLTMDFTGVREKGNKMVDVIFLDNTEKLLREWIEYRKSNGIDVDYIFITKENKEYRQMAQSTIRNRIKKIGGIIGYNKLYPHTLRKTAINLLKNWSDINTAAEFANHNDTKTTVEHYIKAKTGTENRNKILQIRREKGLI